MKTTTEKTVNYTTGQELLRKAVSREKEACRFYAQYVQWVAEESIPIEVITTQLIEAKGWQRTAARTAAERVKLLGEVENSTHLEALLNGEINFDIARMRVGNTVTPDHSKRSMPYQDDETAVEHVQKAIKIMIHRHKKWSEKDFLKWISEICKATLNAN